MVFTGMGTENEMEVQITGDASGFNQALDGASTSMSRFRSVAALTSGALTVLAGKLAQVAVSSAASFEDAMVDVERVTDPQTVQELTQEIDNMANTMPVAREELASMTQDVARFGIEGSENIANFTETVAQMAVATDLTNDKAGEAFARLITLTDVTSGEVENLGSAINSLGNNFATSSSEIVDSMLRSAAAMNQLGIQDEDMLALTTSVNEVSESARRAGTRLRRLAQQMMEPQRAEELAGALGMTTERFTDIRDEAPLKLIRRMAVAFQENGEAADELREILATPTRQALGGLAQNMEGLENALATSNKSFEEGTSIQKEYELAADTLNARLQILKNRIRGVSVETGENMSPAIRNLVQDATDLVSAFGNLNQATDGLAGTLTIAGIAAAGLAGMFALGGPILSGIAVAAAAIGTLGTAWATNFLGMRDTTRIVASDITNTLTELTSDTDDELSKQIGIWEKWEIRITQGLEELGYGFAQFIDLVATGFKTINEAVKMGKEQFKSLAKGDFEGAVEAQENFASDISQMNEQMRERRQERLRERQERREARRSALRNDDPSLLPGNENDSQSQSETPTASGDYEMPDGIGTDSEQYKEIWENIEQNTDKTARTMEQSALSEGPCDLREQLLGPLEEVPQSASAAVDGTETSDTQNESSGNAPPDAGATFPERFMGNVDASVAIDGRRLNSEMSKNERTYRDALRVDE